MKLPFWTLLLKQLQIAPSKTDFEFAAQLASSPETCLIAEAHGFKKVPRTRLNQKAYEIYESFSGSLFSHYPDLTKANRLLRRAKRLKTIYK